MKKITILFVVIILFTFLLAVNVSAWWSGSWAKRRPVTVTYSGTALSNYQIEVHVVYDSDMQSNFDDIRFIDSDDSTSLDHWRATYNSSADAIFWVEVGSIPNGGKTIYMYYDNAAASTASDGSATFLWFDDFESYSTGDIEGKGDWGGSGCCGNSPYLVTTGDSFSGSKSVISTTNQQSVCNASGINSGQDVLLDYRTKVTNIRGKSYPTDDLILEIENVGLTYWDRPIRYRGLADWENWSSVVGYHEYNGTDIAFTANVWYHHKVGYYNGNKADVWQDGTQVLSAVSTHINDIDQIDLRNDPGFQEAYFDDIFIRKYMHSGEPTTSVGSESSSNSAPSSSTISESSTSASPTNVGSDVTFSGTITDPDTSDQVRLAICKTDAISGTGTCSGGAWCYDPGSATYQAEGVASCSYTTLVGDSTTNAWYAYACDDDNACTAMTESDGTFHVNHRPATGASSSDADSAPGTNVGSDITFTMPFTDSDSDTAKIHVCKTDSMTGTSCTGGSWCDGSTFGTSSRTCAYTASVGDGTSNDYFVFACDSHGFCDSSSDSGTFYVNHAPVTGASSSDADSAPGILPGNDVTFTMPFTDSDSDTAKIHVCKTDSMTGTSCTGGSWCDGSTFGTSSRTCQYTVQSGDNSPNNYYVFACDSHGFCDSTSDSGIWYAQVGGTKGDISTVKGTTPFYSISSNPQSGGCLDNMGDTDTCTVTWTVNATGACDTVWDFFTTAESTTYPGSVSNSVSDIVNINISCGHADGHACTKDRACLSSNCQKDYDLSGQWCAPPNKCAHSATGVCDSNCYGFTSGQTDGGYVCRACSGHDAHWIKNSGGVFAIQDTSGNDLMVVDDRGEMAVAGSITVGTPPTIGGDNDFVIKTSGGTAVLVLDAASGDLTILGSLSTDQTITPSGNNDFIIKKNGGDNVFMVDTATGDLQLSEFYGESCTLS